MIVKPMLVAVTLSVVSAVPFIVTGVFNIPVRMSVGPVAAVFEPNRPVDLDLNAQCLAQGCPALSIEVGESFSLGF